MASWQGKAGKAWAGVAVGSGCGTGCGRGCPSFAEASLPDARPCILARLPNYSALNCPRLANPSPCPPPGSALPLPNLGGGAGVRGARLPARPLPSSVRAGSHAGLEARGACGCAPRRLQALPAPSLSAAWPGMLLRRPLRGVLHLAPPASPQRLLQPPPSCAPWGSDPFLPAGSPQARRADQKTCGRVSSCLGWSGWGSLPGGCTGVKSCAGLVGGR